MKQALIADPNDSRRKEFILQLAQEGFNSTLEFRTLEEAQRHLLPRNSYEGTLFVSIDGEISELEDFLPRAQAQHPLLVAIAVLETSSTVQMSALLSAGVDQILFRPFDRSQLLQKFKVQKIPHTQLGESSPSDQFKSLYCQHG